ncbi:glycoside hydrolase family 97 protein [Aquimonas sp.]|uniref:glycoside hydrolase family 97 protein n=1 Tax=Aquimonas sp. TaxID=1872588 RepID=UPI0037C07972
MGMYKRTGRWFSTAFAVALAALGCSAAAALQTSLEAPGEVPAREQRLLSPDGRTAFVIEAGAERLEYWIERDGEQVVERSPLGLVFRQSADFGPGFGIVGAETASVDLSWEQPWGERRRVHDRHQELRVDLQRIASPHHRFSLRVRLFDDGVGFRYEVPEQDGLAELDILDELTEFRIPKPGETQAWWIPGRGWNRYEYLYRSTRLAELDRAHTPLTLRLPSGVHLAIHEAALVDYASMVVDQQRDGVLKADLTPWFDGVRVRTRAGFHTPWRSLHIADTAVGLLNSDLILNLNEPNALGDVSWVEPGKYVGIWWGMHLGTETWGTGARHGATTRNARRYIDFAAENGFSGVLVEGWNLGWDGDWFNNGDVFDFLQPYPDFDLEAVAAYARERGLRLVGHHETAGSVSHYARQMEAAFDLYQRLGVRQIKTGYVADGGGIKRIDQDGVRRREWHDGQFMVNEHLRTVRAAAARQISINAHEPIKDTGLRRTYPNWIAREGARGQEYNAWGTPPNPPEHVAMLPYTRMLSGPMDYTPGIFNLAYEGLDAVNRVQHTLAKELSLYVVLYSPIQMVADLPEHYAAHPRAFQFIKDVPTDWEQSRALAGEVGDYVVFARRQRNGDDWFVGALTDEAERSFSLKLGFLQSAQTYCAHLYLDGEGAHWRTRPYAMRIEKREVNSSDTLDLWLAASGGAAIRFEAIAAGTSCADAVG